MKKAREVIVIADNSVESFLVMAGSDGVFDDLKEINSVHLAETNPRGGKQEFVWVVNGDV